jgi:hypothetical protein
VKRALTIALALLLPLIGATSASAGTGAPPPRTVVAGSSAPAATNVVVQNYWQNNNPFNIGMIQNPNDTFYSSMPTQYNTKTFFNWDYASGVTWAATACIKMYWSTKTGLPSWHFFHQYNGPVTLIITDHSVNWQPVIVRDRTC